MAGDTGAVGQPVLLADVAAVSATVASTPARSAKIAAIADLLARAGPTDVPAAAAFLSGELLQRQIGVGYAALTGLLQSAENGNEPPARPTLTLASVDAAFRAIGQIAGQGSAAARRALLGQLWRQATEGEREFLVRLLSGDLRQGALEGVMTEAVARAAGVPAADVRRAHQLAGFLPVVAQAALGSGSAAPGTAARRESALAALRAVTLQVGRPIRPMLAASAPNVEAALGRVSPAALEWKIDGIRIQVHKNGDDVAIYTRTLDDITQRVPEIAALARSLRADRAVVDGEAVALRPDGRPHPFQVTSARTASQGDVEAAAAGTPLDAFFFDIVYLDGDDLTEAAGSDRFARLAEVVPPGSLIPRIVTGDVQAAGKFFADAVQAGHEGIVVKSLDGPYRAGRRGADWIKVKPRHTLDLVILAAEWGHGRRRGWLSNLHLGARDPADPDRGFVMLGKTFKGLTDRMLEWQTSRLLELADPPADPASRREHGVVHVRPELVAEIAFDGVQASRRYPGGLALRFARVLRYREDKTPADADTIDTVRALWPAEPAGDLTPERGQPG
jgi:ATP-dependent DNA ligase I